MDFSVPVQRKSKGKDSNAQCRLVKSPVRTSHPLSCIVSQHNQSYSSISTMLNIIPASAQSKTRMNSFVLMVVLGLMSIVGSQPVGPAAAGSILKRTVDFYLSSTPDLEHSEPKEFNKRSDDSYATYYPRTEYPHVQRFYPIAGSTMLIGYPLVNGHGGINGYGGFDRVIPIHGHYNYGR